MREEKVRRLMMECFKAGVQAVHPETCLEAHLPLPPPNGKIILLAGGKAAGAMMKVAIDHYIPLVDKERLLGVAVGKPDGFAPMHHMEWIEAGHPVPDEGSVRGAMRVLQLAHEARENDLVVVLLSGGASALWCAPVEGLSLTQKQRVTRDLLHSGATINEINCVRKHLSGIKAGRLALAAFPARMVTLAISDVVGDDHAIIGSGPGYGERSNLIDVRLVLAKYKLPVEKNIYDVMTNPQKNTPLPDADEFAGNSWQCIANGARALASAGGMLRARGFQVINLGDAIEGEAREVAREDAERIRLLGKAGEKLALLAGGELTVTLKGRGRGGPNQEYALALAMELGKMPGGLEGVSALCADTDGCDGGTGKRADPAGAMIFPSTLARARAQKLNPATFLADNNSGTFFAQLDDLLITGATYTNVNDFRLIFIEKV